ncbi:MobF family relaxase [Leptolyngbya sp. 7M]|uniref:MobF family relaxase n=1 Tax=Leptolyngbya sp. 7M TaxID=2812896 RepID=UPI001B8CC986|nr:MobF family relaxase [Leptolyngbya sp. 7M]QYO62913.1 relaxase domain-containing protein [Leptolyngbya sp. 7M]
MLRVTQSNSAARAKSYYSTADYYTEGQELVGLWRGKGAARLKLSGMIDRDDWDLLCDNRQPETGEALTPRRKDERRVGYDFNFHCPKSVSLLYGLTQDQRILQAFRESVEATMEDIEAESKARVRRGGKNEDRLTGNLAWGEFVHFTARPEDGVPDPHLHAHCFVFNGTFDEQEDRWKAVQVGDIKRDAPYFEAVFHSRFARRLEELGLETRRTVNGWELTGIAPETLTTFSRRTARIEKLAKARGITNPDAKAELGAQTRSGKAKEMSMPELNHLWRSRMTEQELASLDAVRRRVGRDPIGEDDRAALGAVERAMAHSFERASVLPERTFLAEALRQGYGVASRETIERLAGKQPLIRATRDGRQLVTSLEVLEEEKAMLRFAREGRGTCRPIHLGTITFPVKNFSEEQKRAVRHVVTSKDRVVLIRGAAGAGKTSMMKVARDVSVAIAAENVILAAGTIGTTRILLNSAKTTPAIANPRIGKGLILHPSVPLIGIFDKTIKLLEGLDSATFVEAFGVTPGFIFETMGGLPAYGALLVPGNGKQVYETVSQFNQCAGFGTMLVDTPSDDNCVSLDEQGDVMVQYGLSDSDKQRLRTGVAIGIRMMFMAGAKQVIIPSNENFLNQENFDPMVGVYLTDIAQADLVERNLNFTPNRTLLTAAHLQATNKMSSSPETGVVSKHQRVWNVLTGTEIPNLYIMDSSIFPTSVGANPMQTIYTFAYIFSKRLLQGMA